MIPHALLDAWHRHAKAGKRAGLFVRHAEREPVVDLRTHEAALLTAQGKVDAHESGARMAKLSSYVRVHHSPVERCRQTADAIVEGALAAGARAEVVQALAALGSPFILDQHRASELIGSGEASVRGGFRKFMRDWFDGKHPPDILMARGPASLTQQACLLEHLERKMARDMSGVAGDDDGALHVFVSHDWNIMIVREEVLGIKLEESWPHYLDGFVVALDGAELVVESHGKSSPWKRHA